MQAQKETDKVSAEIVGFGKMSEESQEFDVDLMHDYDERKKLKDYDNDL